MKIENIYTSIACNRHPASLDYDEKKGVIFGANHAVAYFQPGKSSTLITFAKHKSTVLTVCWIRNCERKVFVSGSNDKKAIVWDISDETTQSFTLDHNGESQVCYFKET